MRTRRKYSLTLGLAAIAAALASAPLAGCADQTDPAVDTHLATASVRDFEITTRATGELEARNQVELRSGVKRETTVVEVVPEGSRVKAGDVIIRLNSEEIEREIEEEEIQLTEARLNLEAAQAAYEIQLSDNDSNLRKAQLNVRLADLALEQWREGDLVKKRQELQTAIEKARRDYERLERKVAKSEELYSREFLSFDELERDRIAKLEAEAKLETALLEQQVYETYQLEKDQAQKTSDLAEARQELERVQKANEINLKNRASRRENRAVQVGRREERLADYQQQFEACVIIAPTNGLVVYGSTAKRDHWRWRDQGALQVGSRVGNNDLLIVLPDVSEMVASVKVHEAMAGRVEPGQRATVRVDAAGDVSVPGRVESIGVLAEGGGWRDPNRREYTVRISLQDIPASLKPSMRCDAEIILGAVDEALCVPVQAVFAEGPVNYVHVPEGQRYRRLPIRIGRRSDLYAEVLAGLEPGADVLVREPDAAEIIDEPWDETELAAAGYGLDDEGNPVVARAESSHPTGQPVSQAARPADG